MSGIRRAQIPVRMAKSDRPEICHGRHAQVSAESLLQGAHADVALHRQRRGGLTFPGDAAFANARPFDDPLVGGVDPLFELDSAGKRKIWLVAHDAASRRPEVRVVSKHIAAIGSTSRRPTRSPCASSSMLKVVGMNLL